MIQLREYQVKAVEDLTAKAMMLVSTPGRRRKLVFKAPTGSGKTVMMGAWLRKMAATLPFQPSLPHRRFAYLWIAPNQLHQQSLLKLRSYFEETRDLRCLEFDGLSDNALSENDLLFFNWQSINSEDNVVIRENERGWNLSSVLARTEEAGVGVIVVLDEAHLFAVNGQRAQNVLRRIDAWLEVDVSATPVLRGDLSVEIWRQQVVQAEMIKKSVVLNPGVDDPRTGMSVNEYMLRAAVERRNDLARRHEVLGSPVRPLLLIQLPNDKETMSEEDAALRQMIEKGLETLGGTVANGKLAVWLSGQNGKINLEGIERPDSVVEAMLFKQAVAQGWDCPRAAVLLIYRELQATSFTIQTVGRILRMPELRHYGDDVLNYGYVYTNLSKNMIEVVQDDMDFFPSLRARRTAAYQAIQIESSHINRRIVRNRLGAQFRLALEVAAMKDGWISPRGKMEAPVRNAERLAGLGWNLDAYRIEIPIPKDVWLDGGEQQIQANTVGFARTPAELEGLLHRFSVSACGEYAPVESAPVLRQALLEFLQTHLEMGEDDAARVVLANPEALFKLLERARTEYADILRQKAASADKRPEPYSWEVPEERWYHADQYVEKLERRRHALQPPYAQKAESGPERVFAELLERHADCLDWWYKNGDHGKEHFAIPYRNLQGEWALFHVDFLMRFKNGALGFFDTKTRTGDSEAFHKHNALLEFLDRLTVRHPGGKFVGGIVIQDGAAWKYSLDKLSPGFDLKGWVVFDPHEYAALPVFGV